MSELFPLIFMMSVLLLLGGLTAILFKYLIRTWWEHRWVRWTIKIIPLVGFVCIILWGLGFKSQTRILTGIGATGAALTGVVELALLLALPFSGIVHIIGFLIHRKKGQKSYKNIDPKRREFIKAAAAVFPALSLGSAVKGVGTSFTDIDINRMKLTYPNLPPSLEGIKILQISDCHIGFYVMVDDIAEMLEEAKDYNPDMILVTGDIADKLEFLPETLKIIDQLKPPLGCYACLGNHEYYRGIKEVRRVFDNSPIPLLVNEGLPVKAGEATIFVGGADDPRVMRSDISDLLRISMESSFKDADSESFKIFMSHRPQGFDPAAAVDIDLTLAGHTHGGQIGFAGRSVFEAFAPEAYLWGHYQKDNGSQLYTSAGAGHWFPFRLGCNSEVPLIELTRG